MHTDVEVSADVSETISHPVQGLSAFFERQVGWTCCVHNLEEDVGREDTEAEAGCGVAAEKGRSAGVVGGSEIGGWWFLVEDHGRWMGGGHRVTL